MGTNRPWPQEKSDLLRKLWKEGKTASEIAKRLGAGTTRAAVCGMARRLNLDARGSSTSSHYAKKVGRVHAANFRAKNPKAPRATSKLAPRFSCEPLPPPSEYDVARKNLVDLEPKDCRFPIGDGPFMFCALPVMEGLSYCPTHARRCLSEVVVKKLEPVSSPVAAKTLEAAE